MSTLNKAFERLQLSLACPICRKPLMNTRIVSECGHFSCRDCALDEVGENGRCPQCKMPAIRKNLQPYHTVDTLSACLQKLRSGKSESYMKLASCSFADDKGLSLPESYLKKRRITPTGQFVEGTYSYEEIDIGGFAVKSKRNKVVTNREVLASQEDPEFVSKPERPTSQVSSTGINEHQSQYVKIVKLVHTSLLTQDEDEVNRALMKIADTNMIIEVYKDTEWINDEITHVITSINERHLCKRTQKYLNAILKGKWVVSHKWLVLSIISGRWLDELEYEVAGDLTTGMTLAPSKGRQMKASKHELFDRLRIYFHGNFQSFPSRNDLMILVRSAGARLLQRRPGDGTGNKISNGKLDIDRPLIVVQDIPTKWKKSESWMKQYQVVSMSWILDAISRLSLKQPIP